MPAFILVVVYTTEIFSDNIDSLLALKYLLQNHIRTSLRLTLATTYRHCLLRLPVLAGFPAFGKHELCPNFLYYAMSTIQ